VQGPLLPSYSPATTPTFVQHQTLYDLCIAHLASRDLGLRIQRYTIPHKLAHTKHYGYAAQAHTAYTHTHPINQTVNAAEH